MNYWNGFARQYFPSPCDIFGNEQADILAKAECLVTQANSSLTLRNIKTIIRSKIITKRIFLYVGTAMHKKCSTKVTKSLVLRLGRFEFSDDNCLRLLTKTFTTDWNQGFSLLPSVPSWWYGCPLKNCPEVFKFLTDNATEANKRLYPCVYSFSLLKMTAHRMMVEMP